MVTFTIYIPPMLAYIPYMDPMGYKSWIVHEERGLTNQGAGLSTSAQRPVPSTSLWTPLKPDRWWQVCPGFQWISWVWTTRTDKGLELLFLMISFTSSVKRLFFIMESCESKQFWSKKMKHGWVMQSVSDDCSVSKFSRVLELRTPKIEKCFVASWFDLEQILGTYPALPSCFFWILLESFVFPQA